MQKLYVFILIMISSFVKSQNLNCNDFKVGKFKIETTNYKLPILNVIRTEKIQQELSEEYKIEFESIIKWISECNYELIYRKGSPEMNGKKVNVEINHIEGSKAICKSTYEALPRIILEFEMEKVQ